VVWLDLGQEECCVFGGGTGGMGTCDGIVMALGIVALVGVRSSHYLLPSEGTRYYSVTILLREMKMQALGKSERCCFTADFGDGFFEIVKRECYSVEYLG